MRLDYVPLLEIQRDLYRLPRGWERFQEYLKTMIDAETRDLKLPLVAMNPMGKDHIPALLDEYLSLKADTVAEAATAEASANLTTHTGNFKVTLVITDDAMGAWTNRYATEFSHRFESKALVKRGWLAGLIWTSERPSLQAVREEILSTIYRTAHIQQHGYAASLRDMLTQEGYGMALAGIRLDEENEEMNYIREVIGAHLDRKDYPTLIACLFGDEAAGSLGYEALGLPSRAGLRLALYDALR